MEEREVFGHDLRVARQQVGLTQKALGKRIGAASVAVHRAEVGRHPLPIAALERLRSLFPRLPIPPSMFVDGRKIYPSPLAPDSSPPTNLKASLVHLQLLQKLVSSPVKAEIETLVQLFAEGKLAPYDVLGVWGAL